VRVDAFVRDVLLGPSPRRYAGCTSWRAVVKPSNFQLAEDHGLLLLGPGSQLGIMGVGQGRYYFFATRTRKRVPAPAGEPVADPRTELLRWFGGWTEPVPTLLAALHDEEIIHTDLYDRPPAPCWGRGRITMLGDSIHPTTPNLGQGACQALESAVWLAYALKTRGILEEALRAYEAARRPRTASVTRQSWSTGLMLTWRHPVLVWLRNALFRWSPFQRLTQTSLESLIGWSVPAL
jgi:2-polyprenyl-6-methoxyphenol hydroxylase-like FAD-dependent oxidoreductase